MGEGSGGLACHARRVKPHSITLRPPAYTTLERRRLATAGLLATLGVLHPRWHFCFLALLMLDVFSHWFQMYASLVSGAATHKVHLAPRPRFVGPRLPRLCSPACGSHVLPVCIAVGAYGCSDLLRASGEP
jgi:hypothetical protein